MGRSATETIRLRTGSSECHSTVHSTAEAEGPARGPSIAPTVWTTRGRPSSGRRESWRRRGLPTYDEQRGRALNARQSSRATEKEDDKRKKQTGRRENRHTREERREKREESSILETQALDPLRERERRRETPEAD
ncbi:unnamed protein product [Boreogadus saida]